MKMVEDLIEVKQLPIIKEQLKKVSKEIDEKVEKATSLICTEENKQTVKSVRSDMKKELEEFETKRKAIKEQILEPYNEFNKIYEEYISNKYKSADKTLKDKIDNIEKEQKKKLEDEARRYFEEYKASKNIDFITFEKMNLKIGVSDNPTKLKKQIVAFIDKIEEELNIIETQEHKAEILVEYKQTLNVSNAITTVVNRFKAIEEEKKKDLKEKIIEQMSEEADKAKGITQKDKELVKDFIDRAVERDNILKAPIEEKQEEILTVSFKVKGTRTKLRLLKEFLQNGGYDYE